MLSRADSIYSIVEEVIIEKGGKERENSRSASSENPWIAIMFINNMLAVAQILNNAPAALY